MDSGKNYIGSALINFFLDWRYHPICRELLFNDLHVLFALWYLHDVSKAAKRQNSSLVIHFAWESYGYWSSKFYHPIYHYRLLKLLHIYLSSSCNESYIYDSLELAVQDFHIVGRWGKNKVTVFLYTSGQFSHIPSRHIYLPRRGREARWNTNFNACFSHVTCVKTRIFSNCSDPTLKVDIEKNDRTNAPIILTRLCPFVK